MEQAIVYAGDAEGEAIVYARVSTKRQKNEGYSLAAQVERCEDYARDKKLEVVEVIEEAWTGTTVERPGYQAMLERVRNDASITHVLVHQQDRFTRGSEFGVIRDEFQKLGVGFVSVTEQFGEGPAAEFAQDVNAAKNRYVAQDIKFKTKVGKNKAARLGWYPSEAPVGYLNMPRGEAIRIVPDPNTAPLITEAYELMASGKYTLKNLAQEMTVKGLNERRSKKALSTSSMGVLGVCETPART